MTPQQRIKTIGECIFLGITIIIIITSIIVLFTSKESTNDCEADINDNIKKEIKIEDGIIHH